MHFRDFSNYGNCNNTHESIHLMETMLESFDINKIPEGNFSMIFNIIYLYQQMVWILGGLQDQVERQLTGWLPWRRLEGKWDYTSGEGENA